MKTTYDEVINRLGFFRNLKKLSAREVSFRLGYTEQFLSRIENKSVEMKVSTLLDYFEAVGITAQDFFYLGKQYSEENKKLLSMFAGLSSEGQATIIDLMKKLK